MPKSIEIFGFHSIESIIKSNPELVLNVLIQNKRRDKRINELINTLSSQKISISQMKQKEPSKGKATLIMTTHKTLQENLSKALHQIKKSKICFGEPVSIRIQEI